MSALSEAIASGRPSTTLDASSPLGGLRRGSVGTIDLIAQSVAAVAPAGILLTHAGLLASRAGSFGFLTLVVTAGVIVLVALSMSVFARRISAAGGIYTFVTRGLGPVVGMLAGVAIAFGYASVAIGTLRSGVRRIDDLLTGPDVPGSETPTALTVAIVGLCSLGVVALIIFGARTSTRILLVIEIIAVTAILALSVAVFASTGWDLRPLLPDPTAPPTLSSLAAAMGMSLVAFVGFESGAALGPESRRPLATVPRALVWTVVAVAIVYLFGVGAQLSARANGSVGRTSSIMADATSLDATWIDPTIDAVIAASWIACTLACSNALVRLVFTMSREGVLPAWLGRTSRRFATPHRAAIAVGALLAVGTVLHFMAGRGSLLDETIDLASSLGFVIAYLLVCAAVVPYLLRLREFSLREAWPAVLGTAALAAITVAEVLGAEELTRVALVILVALLAAGVLAHAVRLRSGSLSRKRAGAYDTPVAMDALATRGESLTRP